MKDTVRPYLLISEEEKAKRKKGVDYARASVMLEGGILYSEIEALSQKYVNGELTQEEFTLTGLELIDRLYTDER